MAVFAGGYTSSTTAYLYDSLTGTWLTSPFSQSRFYTAAAVVGNSGLFAGGLGGGASTAVDIYTVPEPTTLSLLVVGAAGMMAGRRRARK